MKTLGTSLWTVNHACPICFQRKLAIGDVRLTLKKELSDENRLLVTALLGICLAKGHLLNAEEAEQIWQQADNNNGRFFRRLGSQPQR